MALGGAMGMLGGCSAPVPPMRVGSVVFPGYEMPFLARERGWLDERHVRLVELLSSTDTLRALAAGQLEAAMLTLDEMLSARGDGVDLRAVLVLDVSHGGDVVLARPPLTLNSLAGRRVAVEDSAVGAIMLSALLAATGMRIEQVKKVSFSMDRSVAYFREGRADVIITVEPWASQLERLGARRIFDSTRIPGRIVDVLAVRADVARRHAQAIRHLVAAHFQALQYWTQEPAQAATFLAPRLQMAPAEVPDAFRGLQLMGVQENRTWMQRDGGLANTLRDLQQVMLQDALLRRTVSVADVVDPSFLPKNS
jgi:NitT/TauT family transport system substrate-binding protein